jgi:hypothetical protein
MKRLLEKIPALEADESIRMATRVAVGSGTLDADARDRVTRAWEWAADTDRAVVKGAPEGVKVVRVPKRETPTN